MAEEMLEIVDAMGVPTGEILPKSVIHREGHRHLGAHGFVTDGRGNLLCQKRGPECKMMRNMWDPIGFAGHVPAWDPNNGPRPCNVVWTAETLVMESQEEIGYQLDLGFFQTRDAAFFGITHTSMVVEDGWLHNVVDFNWMLRLPDINPDDCPLEEGKVLAVEWRPIDQIEREALTPGIILETPYTVREPDNYRLISTACHQARLMTR